MIFKLVHVIQSLELLKTAHRLGSDMSLVDLLIVANVLHCLDSLYRYSSLPVFPPQYPAWQKDDGQNSFLELLGGMRWRLPRNKMKRKRGISKNAVIVKGEKTRKSGESER